MLPPEGTAMSYLRLLLCLVGLATIAPAYAQDASNEKSVQKLRLAKFVMPEFPEFVRQAGTTRGVVTAAIGRDAEGQVTDVLVLSSTHALLSQSVTNAVRQWKFVLPANPAPADKPILPIVRFIFSARGISIVTALTGSLAAKDRDVDEKAPVVLPSFAELDEPPKALNRPMPRFTGAMAERAVGGTVTVRFFVDETGQARVPIIIECTTPELGLATLAAVEQWRFEPPRAAGQPTIVLETETFTFQPTKL
jgi:TonB family protein